MRTGGTMALAITLAIGTLAAGAKGQSGASPEPKNADWSGFYKLARTEKELQGFKPVNPDMDAVATAHLQPWARMKMEATDGVSDDTGQTCQPNGIFRYPNNVGLATWMFGADKVVIASRSINTAGVRRIYLNRSHPRKLLPTWNGDSIGRWEGDTLVVDTIGFNDKSWLFLGMEPHTEELHLRERIRRVADGLIEVQSIVEDRKAFTSAYTFTRYFWNADPRTWADTQEVADICNEDPEIWWGFRNQRLLPAIEESRQVR
jgi:hypothetical protein